MIKQEIKQKPSNRNDSKICCDKLMQRGYLEDSKSAYIFHTCLVCGHEFGYTVYA